MVQMLMVWATGIFALIVAVIITAYVLDIFWSGGAGDAPIAGTTSIFTNNTYAANLTVLGKRFFSNFFTQLPAAGSLMGVAIIMLVVGLMGVGGYMAYQKVR